ncbi:hypothetical protein F511_31533 [Dorcoceras hygrometricum]|uniref:Uncharacterized protein n=1 Tax=Dorcoceras hygrometricum TaxID=472368 RepID=A0A2Z7CPY1_9LAMI|nr:hypothetical protein F511_31533 [Dorcoceras hygrometricum]
MPWISRPARAHGNSILTTSPGGAPPPRRNARGAKITHGRDKRAATTRTSAGHHALDFAASARTWKLNSHDQRPTSSIERRPIFRGVALPAVQYCASSAAASVTIARRKRPLFAAIRDKRAPFSRKSMAIAWSSCLAFPHLRGQRASAARDHARESERAAAHGGGRRPRSRIFDLLFESI